MGARVTQQCVHCAATETPLWRAGPDGPKTLCNACGVRWKKTGSVVPRAKRTIAKSSRSAPQKKQEQQQHHQPHPSSSSTTADNHNNNNNDVREAYAALPAPKPRAAVRVHDAGKRNYESVFSGLMVVPRPGRVRTRTARAQSYFDGVASRPAPSPSPPPDTKEKDTGSVYVTEVIAPSPSPSPPPIPRIQRFPEGQGFRIVLAPAREQQKESKP